MEETIRIEDHKLEIFGEEYRVMAWPNNVLLLEGRPLTFEGFLRRIGAIKKISSRA